MQPHHLCERARLQSLMAKSKAALPLSDALFRRSQRPYHQRRNADTRAARILALFRPRCSQRSHRAGLEYPFGRHSRLVGTHPFRFSQRAFHQCRNSEARNLSLFHPTDQQFRCLYRIFHQSRAADPRAVQSQALFRPIGLKFRCSYQVFHLSQTAAPRTVQRPALFRPSCSHFSRPRGDWTAGTTWDEHPSWLPVPPAEVLIHTSGHPIGQALHSLKPQPRGP